MANDLFTPYQVGALELTHRVVLAPMSRYRCSEEMAPNSLVREYYEQRASPGGLLVSEATHINPEGTPIWNIYPAIREGGGEAPGIWTEEQTMAYQKVVESVHAKGAYISCQLQHCGRVAQDDIKDHPLVKESGLPIGPVSASAMPISSNGEIGNHYNWDQPSLIPRALTISEISRVCDDYAWAARNALKAGFDFVEIHAGHGYLIDQFLCDSVNKRKDHYGGSFKNRCRFLYEVVEAVLDVVGSHRLSVRLSPTFEEHIQYFNVSDSDPGTLYETAIRGLNSFPLAYLLLTEPRAGGLSSPVSNDPAFSKPLSSARFRSVYHGTLMAAGGFTPFTANRAIKDGTYDLIAFGRWFLSNPDLPDRIRRGSSLNIYERDKFYSNGSAGYTDYPTQDGKIGFIGKYPVIKQHELR